MASNAALSQNIFNFLSESQYWQAGAMRDYQQGQLEQLLRHARVAVPFYTSRLDVLFRHNGTIDWSRWASLPILTRADVSAHRQAMLANEIPKSHGATKDHSSSGTTGHPVTVRHTGLAGAVWRAALWRSHTWYGTDWSATMCYWLDPKFAERPRDPEFDSGRWGPPDGEGASHGHCFGVLRTVPITDRIAHLNRHRVRYLTAPSNLAFAAALEARRLGLKAEIDTIFSSTLAIEPEHRQLCKEVFGADIQSLYSSMEVGQIAHSCSSGPHFHVDAEFALVEIVDTEGRPVPDGVSGRVVITPFLNSAQPLIRYDQGDIAAMAHGCSCGRTLPVIAEIQGRTLNMFRYPGGRLDVPKVPDYLRHELHAVTWQFAQVAVDTVEVRYLPSDPAAGFDAQAIAEKIRFHLNADFRVTFKPISAIPQTPSGKYLKYVCELT